MLPWHWKCLPSFRQILYQWWEASNDYLSAGMMRIFALFWLTVCGACWINCCLPYLRHMGYDFMIDLCCCVRDERLNFLWEQMLGMELAQLVQSIGVVVLFKIHIQQYVLLDFFLKKVMVYMWQGMFLILCVQIF